MQDDEQGSSRGFGVVSGGPELRLAPPPSVCAACGARASSADTFCTTCGHILRGDSDNVSAAETTVSAASPSASERTLLTRSPPPHPAAPVPRPRRWLRIAVPVAILALLAASATFAVFWRSQANHAHRLQARLEAATAQLAETRATLASTQSKLASTSALSAKRRAVLLKAQAVLKRVDPLLSDADGIKQITSKIQTARDAFAADSAQMTSDLLDLENYEANPDYYPYVNEAALVDQVNSELATVRADYATLTSQDTAFSGASTKFGSHADAFTNAVRSLQTQLKGVAGP